MGSEFFHDATQGILAYFTEYQEDPTKETFQNHLQYVPPYNAIYKAISVETPFIKTTSSVFSAKISGKPSFIQRFVPPYRWEHQLLLH